MGMSFDSFVEMTGPRLRAALVAAYGVEIGQDAAAEALAYAWEHWERIQMMRNPVGYLYRVGQTASRRARRPQGLLPAGDMPEQRDVEPRLLPALAQLSDSQRVAVLMVHGYGWSITSVAEVLEVSVSTVWTHLSRALVRLQAALEVDRVD